MGLFSTIENVFSSVNTFISGTVLAIGSKISEFAKNTFRVFTQLPRPQPDIIAIVSIVANILHTVIDFLGIKSEDDPEILGAKAKQSDKSLDDFDNNVEAYINYLKNEVELDMERFNKMTPEDKLGCKMIGMSLETKAVEEKIGGIEISPECLSTLGKIQNEGINIDAKELVKIIEVLREQGITNMNDVVELLEGKGSSDRLKTGEAFVTALGEGARNRLFDLQDAVRKYEEE